MMRSFMILLVAAAGVSCASSTPKPDTEIHTPTDRIVASDNTGVIRTSVPPNARVLIQVPPARTIELLKSVYEELGVPPGTYDAANGKVGNTSFWKSRKLGNTNISTYLNCGESLSGTIADNYRVYMSILSAVRPSGSGSELETAFSAYAVNMEGTAGDRIPCGTTGRLEDLLQKGVVRRAGASQ